MFELSEDQRLVRDMVREFAQKELSELAPQLDAEAAFPKDIFGKMAQLGLLGLRVPEEYGGGQMDLLAAVLAAEELGKVCASTATAFAVHSIVVAGAIKLAGTEEQKKKYLPLIASGRLLCSMSLSEPDTTSGVPDIELGVSRNGAGYRLSGQKRSVLCGPNAGALLLLAADGDDVYAFIVEGSAAGISFEREEAPGLCAAGLYVARLDDCDLEEGFVLGGAPLSSEVLEAIACLGKLSAASVAIGVAQTALEASIEHSKQRKQFGQYICEFEGLRWMLADMFVDVACARESLYALAARAEKGDFDPKEFARAKLVASKVATKAAVDAIQIRGGYGYMRDYPIERLLRDAKAFEFAFGALPKQKDIIARELLK